jgi:cysteine rich repeat protein
MVVKYLLVAATGLSLSCSNAQAQLPLTLRACAPDIKSHCAHVASGKGRLKSCVKEHFQDFSNPCAERLALLATVDPACDTDVRKSCGGVKPRRGRVENCVKAALAKVRDACKERLAWAIAGRR